MSNSDNIKIFYNGVRIINEGNYFLETMSKAMNATGNTILANDLMDIVLENKEALDVMKIAFNQQIVSEVNTLKLIKDTIRENNNGGGKE